VGLGNMERRAACPLRLYCNWISRGMGVSSCGLLVVMVVGEGFWWVALGACFFGFCSTGVKPTPRTISFKSFRESRRCDSLDPLLCRFCFDGASFFFDLAFVLACPFVRSESDPRFPIHTELHLPPTTITVSSSRLRLPLFDTHGDNEKESEPVVRRRTVGNLGIVDTTNAAREEEAHVDDPTVLR